MEISVLKQLCVSVQVVLPCSSHLRFSHPQTPSFTEPADWMLKISQTMDQTFKILHFQWASSAITHTHHQPSITHSSPPISSPGGAWHFFGGGLSVAPPRGFGLRLRPVAAGQQRPGGAAGGEDQRTPARCNGGMAWMGALGALEALGPGNGVNWLECGNMWEDIGRWHGSMAVWRHGSMAGHSQFFHSKNEQIRIQFIYSSCGHSMWHDLFGVIRCEFWGGNHLTLGNAGQVVHHPWACFEHP